MITDLEAVTRAYKYCCLVVSEALRRAFTRSIAGAEKLQIGRASLANGQSILAPLAQKTYAVVKSSQKTEVQAQFKSVQP